MSRLDIAIVGGGQAGLALGHHLARQGRRFEIFDAAPRVGHAWRTRWDSLRLLTPCPYNDLPGRAFPAPRWSFPHKDEVADYLEDYAAHFALPIRLSTPVLAVRRRGERFALALPDREVEAAAVVIATGPFRKPAIPEFAAAGGLYQLHSSDYKNPLQIPAGEVLVVGCGNSGAGIAQDLAATHRVTLSLGDTASSPRTILGRDLFWWAHTFGLTRVPADSWLGRRMQGGPDGLIGATPEALADAHGLRLAPRLTGLADREARFADDTRRRFDAVIWATGFRPDFGLVELPVFDERGRPRHREGVSADPGLCFLGLPWQRRIDSSLLGGVGRDAGFLAAHLARHLAGAHRPAPAASWRTHAPRP